MPQKEMKNIASSADRMGRFIGQLRNYEGVSLYQLSHGLCTVSYLNKVENGEREVGKLLTDAFFQRLGKPVELFERILDWDEFQQWKQRQEIILHLSNGNVAQARECAAIYRETVSSVLDQQFLEIVNINCMALTGASPHELLSLVSAALELTQPNFVTIPIESMFLSQNEGRLLFAYLQLREKTEGFSYVAEGYHSLLRYFKQRRYESRERVYLLPYVALRVIENDYAEGRFLAALSLCEDTLEELTKEQRLFAYDKLLEWKQKIHDAVGNNDQTPLKILSHLKLILNYAPKSAELLVSCDERGNVYCLNQVIRDRRKLLGFSQEELSDGICAPHTLSRIENYGGKIQKKNRRALLQRVNMSGERYDYEVVTDSYDDYLLRSELDRATEVVDLDKAQRILTTLQRRCLCTPTNCQYFIKKEAYLRTQLPDGHPEKITLDERTHKLVESVKLTLPLDIETVDTWPACALSINEILTLLSLSNCYERMKMYEKGLSVMHFLRRSIESSNVHVSRYADLYTQIELNLASILGSEGKYHESSIFVNECIELSIQDQNSAHLARCFLGETWNIYYLTKRQHQDIKQATEQIMDLLRIAYVAALVSGDSIRQKSIPLYCRKILKEEFSF